MPYNSTRKERQRRAAQDLAKKLQLEVILAKEMRSIFRKISKSASYLYVSTGGRLNVLAFKGDIRDTLAKHYRRTFKKFQPQMRNEINAARKKAIDDDDTVDDDLDDANNDYVTIQSDAQANQIVSTTQKKLNQAYAAALAAYLMSGSAADVADAPKKPVAQGGVTEPDATISMPDHASSAPIDRTAVADSASQSFDADADVRSNVIATTETQGAAETGKTNVVSALLGTQINDVTDGAVSDQVSPQKSWETIMDGRERDSHAATNGQVQGLASPFVVGGELLMYPGDTSLGASVGNIINCRCSVQYVFPT